GESGRAETGGAAAPCTAAARGGAGASADGRSGARARTPDLAVWPQSVAAAAHGPANDCGAPGDGPADARRRPARTATAPAGGDVAGGVTRAASGMGRAGAASP